MLVSPDEDPRITAGRYTTSAGSSLLKDNMRTPPLRPIARTGCGWLGMMYVGERSTRLRTSSLRLGWRLSLYQELDEYGQYIQAHSSLLPNQRLFSLIATGRNSVVCKDRAERENNALTELVFDPDEGFGPDDFLSWIYRIQEKLLSEFPSDQKVPALPSKICFDTAGAGCTYETAQICLAHECN
ncbi:hypothetical protein QFC20_006612 [Naganishia adeliensis]|uniref:Uncharacterized protein n=1 Tax=Naganishia adeliensis TaxID=92952 RepID=A0ACC2V9G8_9TREE|nr:hypothetical protein QFC20_006612 [Naganishia adeliensis]